MKAEHEFSYDPIKGSFFFSDLEDYKWAKAVIGNLSLKLYINKHTMEPFKLLYSDKGQLLILEGLSLNNGQEIVELFELNGLKRGALDEDLGFKSTSTTLTKPKSSQITPRFSSFTDKKDGNSSGYTEGLAATRQKLIK